MGRGAWGGALSRWTCRRCRAASLAGSASQNDLGTHSELVDPWVCMPKKNGLNCWGAFTLRVVLLNTKVDDPSMQTEGTPGFEDLASLALSRVWEQGNRGTCLSANSCTDGRVQWLTLTWKPMTWRSGPSR